MKWNKEKDILCLFVGHGKSLNGTWDPGTTYKGYTEAGLMLPIVKVAVKYLRKSGIRVITDADEDNNRNMTASISWANRVGAKRVIDVHCDYPSPTASGIAPQYKSAEGKKMGEVISKTISKNIGEKFAGCVKRDDLAMLNKTNAPAMLLETGWIKNDLKYLKSYKKYGKALAQGICKYLGVTFREKTLGEIFCKVLDAQIKDMNKRGFKYRKEYAKCGMSYAQAKKTEKSNCATCVSWACQNNKVNALEPGQIFWINGDNITCKGSGCKSNIIKNFKESHPHKVPTSAKLQKGDICGYGTPHTQVFAGWKKDKKGNKTIPKWYSWGGSDVGDKQPKVKTTYSKKKIDTILRLK